MPNLQSLIQQHNSKVLTDWKKHTRLCKGRHSIMEHQIESSTLGSTTIPNCLGTKGIQLILNFPNTTGNKVMKSFSTRLNGILL